MDLNLIIVLLVLGVCCLSVGAAAVVFVRRRYPLMCINWRPFPWPNSSSHTQVHYSRVSKYPTTFHRHFFVTVLVKSIYSTIAFCSYYFLCFAICTFRRNIFLLFLLYLLYSFFTIFTHSKLKVSHFLTWWILFYIQDVGIVCFVCLWWSSFVSVMCRRRCRPHTECQNCRRSQRPRPTRRCRRSRSLSGTATRTCSSCEPRLTPKNTYFLRIIAAKPTTV